jgi:NADH:ubiquinone oxidoreductase subunit
MGATFGTRLYTRLYGEKVGSDAAGNEYYRERTPLDGRRERRWVIYGGEAEASAVPPEWQGWLTHTVDETPIERPPVERPWQKEHRPNLSGTEHAYRPPGALLRGGRRQRSSDDYEPWTPE